MWRYLPHIQSGLVKFPRGKYLRKSNMHTKINYENQIQVVSNDIDAVKFMRNIAKSKLQDDPFYVFDVNDLIQKYNIWKEKLPRVFPYYAVKSNDYLLVLKILASFGVGFDCASKEEIKKVLSVGVDSSRIIFAHTTKAASHIQYAAEQGVNMMTFDNEFELDKIKSLYPSAKLILRIRSDAVKAKWPLGEKFGCDISTEAPFLLHQARSLNLDIIGVSFHVGFGCEEAAAYRRAIVAAHKLFEIGTNLGFNMTILDIGGGFPGEKHNSIDTFAEVINGTLDEYFPVKSGISIVAEPGQYFVASAFTLATLVHSKREVRNPKTGTICNRMYYINDGYYGSFYLLSIGNANGGLPSILLSKSDEKETSLCSIWGPTCDSVDFLKKDIQFPILNIGDWIFFENMGAYTLTKASTFNGFPIPKVYPMISESTFSSMKEKFQIFKMEQGFDVLCFPESVDMSR